MSVDWEWVVRSDSAPLDRAPRIRVRDGPMISCLYREIPIGDRRGLIGGVHLLCRSHKSARVAPILTEACGDMRMNRYLDFRPAGIRRRAVVMFVVSAGLLFSALWICWIVTSRFVESRYTEQLRNHVEVLSSTIDKWPGLEVQDDKPRESDKMSKEGNYDPCPSQAASALCKMIREAHYDYEGQAPWWQANPHLTGYFFMYSDNLDGIAHGTEPQKYERPAAEIQKKYRDNFGSIADLQDAAFKGAGSIRCIYYDWKPISKEEKVSKLGCVKQIKTTIIPTTGKSFFLGTGMLRSEIESHAIWSFAIMATLILIFYASMLLLFRFYRRDMAEIHRGILDSLGVGVLITRRNEAGDREKILAVNRELRQLYGLDETGASGKKGLEHKALERIIPKDQEKSRKSDPDLDSQRTFLDYTVMLERTGTQLLLRDVAVPLWCEDGPEMLHTIMDRKHSDTYEGFMARFKRYLPPLLLGDEEKVMQQVRQATVLVCELPGIIKLYEEKGIRADECAKDLNQYMEIMLRWAHRKAGAVQELAGDRLVMHFGMTGGASEKDDARPCLEAAMGIKVEIQQLLDKQQQQQRPVAPVRMGIATGQLAVNELGTADRADLIVHGEAMILAELLCNACPAGQILVNERAKDHGSNFNFRDHELAKECTWKEKPIRAFRLTSIADLVAIPTKSAS